MKENVISVVSSENTKSENTKRVTRVFVGGPIQYVTGDSGLIFSDIKALFERILQAISDAGFETLSAHRFERYGEVDVSQEQKSVCLRDFRWMSSCDIFIAVLPASPSGSPIRTDGTCVELGWASAMGKPIVILYSPDAVYSHLVAGLSAVADVRMIPIELVTSGEISIIDIISGVNLP